MMIEVFPSGPFSTNAYVVACPKTRQAAVIDAPPDSASVILSYLKEKELNCSTLILTHSHWDHIADACLFKDKGMKVHIHPLDVSNLRQPGADRLPCWLAIKGVEPDGFLEEGANLSVGELSFTVIHTPGHTPGAICFYEKGEQVLFSGDTLFKGTIGNISFPTSQPELMWGSLEKLSHLPGETKVYPGHGPSTTIQAESWLSRAKEIFG